MAEGFWERESKHLGKQTAKAFRAAAQQLKRDVEAQVNRVFKVKNPSFGEVRVYEFPGRGGRPGAVYVRINPLLSSFAQPSRVTGKPNLIILLPGGKKLGFKRVSDSYPWEAVVKKAGRNNLFSVDSPQGPVIVYRGRDGKNTAIYALRKAVESPKIDFFGPAEKIAKNLDLRIDRQ